MKFYLLHCLNDPSQAEHLANGKVYQFWKKLPMDIYSSDLIDSMTKLKSPDEILESVSNMRALVDDMLEGLEQFEGARHEWFRETVWTKANRLVMEEETQNF